MKKCLLSLYVLCILSTTAQASTEICFSPGNNCLEKLIGKLESARRSIDVAIYAFTAEEIAQVLKAKKNAGVTVRVIIDKSQNSINTYGTQLPALIAAGVSVKFGAAPRIFHHKFSLVDGALLQTGSFNYTYSANNSNAENQLYITDAAVVNAFKAEFNRMWSEGLPVQ